MNQTYYFAPSKTTKIVTYSDTQIFEYLPKSVSALIEEFKIELMTKKEGTFRYVNWLLELEDVSVTLLDLAMVNANGQCLWNIAV